jgi:hypothetical protein
MQTRLSLSYRASISGKTLLEGECQSWGSVRIYPKPSTRCNEILRAGITLLYVRQWFRCEWNRPRLCTTHRPNKMARRPSTRVMTQTVTRLEAEQGKGCTPFTNPAVKPPCPCAYEDAAFRQSAG